MNVQSENELQHLVTEGSDSQLTKEMIVASLRQHGITDLDTFAERSLRALKASEPVPLDELHPESSQASHEDAIVGLLFGDAAQKAAKNTRHAEPRLPFMVGDKAYKPGEVSRFEGKPIHFIWDEEAIAGGLLRACNDPAEMRAVLAGGDGARPAAVARSHVPGAPHTFYQHINFGGNSLSLAYRHAYPDLTAVTMSGWWFWAVSWNDQISSLRAGSGPVILGEHVMNPFLTGATLTILQGQSVAFLGAAWNDRVSAIVG